MLTIPVDIWAVGWKVACRPQLFAKGPENRGGRREIG